MDRKSHLRSEVDRSRFNPGSADFPSNITPIPRGNTPWAKTETFGGFTSQSRKRLLPGPALRGASAPKVSRSSEDWQIKLNRGGHLPSPNYWWVCAFIGRPKHMVKETREKHEQYQWNMGTSSWRRTKGFPTQPLFAHCGRRNQLPNGGEVGAPHSSPAALSSAGAHPPRWHPPARKKVPKRRARGVFRRADFRLGTGTPNLHTSCQVCQALTKRQA